MRPPVIRNSLRITNALSLTLRVLASCLGLTFCGALYLIIIAIVGSLNLSPGLTLFSAIIFTSYAILAALSFLLSLWP